MNIQWTCHMARNQKARLGALNETDCFLILVIITDFNNINAVMLLSPLFSYTFRKSNCP